MVQKQKDSKCNKKEESCRTQMMASNNPSGNRYNMTLVSNPGVCIYPSVVKQQKKVQTLGSSINLALQPRASSIKTGISIYRESSGRVTSQQLNNTKHILTNR